MDDIRPSPIAGKWYSGDPVQLAKEVDEYINSADPITIDGEIVAVVAPHAGYIYSGKTAGYAFRALKGMQVETAVVISPLHSYFSAPLVSSRHSAYATPFGKIDIDRELLTNLDTYLQKNYSLRLEYAARDPEHSLEIELPFLQKSLAGLFQLLPVMIRDQDLKTTQALGNSLAVVLSGKKQVMVASTDLSHFYPQPVAKKLDQEMLHQIESFSPEGVLRAQNSGSGQACGAGAVSAVLFAAQKLGADSVRILHSSTSGDITGDFSSVVGYGAAVIYRKKA